MPGSQLMAERQASDLLLLPGEPPVLRVEGRVSRTDGPVLDGVDIEDMVAAILPPHALARVSRRGTSPMRRAASPDSAGSASTCIASAGVRPPRFG